MDRIKPHHGTDYNHLFGIIVIQLILVSSLSLFKVNQITLAEKNRLAINNQNNQMVLGIAVQNTATESLVNNNPSPSPTQIITVTPEPTNTTSPSETLAPPIVIASSVQTKRTNKSEYTIAIIGDSMIDTMGEYADYLEHRLKKVYPNTTFHMYNYGKGAQTVSDTLGKIDQGFSHQTRNYPPLASVNPDIIITGSFAYNPYSPHDRGRHISELTRIIEKLKSITPNVYLLSEVAPVRGEFGTGPQGVNWEEATNYVHSGNIIEQLENTYGVAQSHGVTLIDVFSQTYNKETGAGNPVYVNPSDHIHPSVYGHEKTAEKIVQVLRLD